MTITYDWRADFENTEVNALHAEAFAHPLFADEDWDWVTQVHRHSLGWVCARDGADLVGVPDQLVEHVAEIRCEEDHVLRSSAVAEAELARSLA